MKNSFIKKLDKAIINQALEDESSLLDAELEKMGYNISEIEKFAQKKFKTQKFFLKGVINKQKDDFLLEKASLLIHSGIEKNLDKPVNYLRTLIQNNQFHVQYRNLENLTNDEIKDIIKDQNLLEWSYYLWVDTKAKPPCSIFKR
jgi:hypothetical protein